MSSRRTALLATLLALALSPPSPDPRSRCRLAPGRPLTVYVDELGQLQASASTANGIFYPPSKRPATPGSSSPSPPRTQTGLTGKVYGFSSASRAERPRGLQPISRAARPAPGRRHR